MPLAARPERRTTAGAICARRNRPVPATASTAKKAFGRRLIFWPKKKDFIRVDVTASLPFEDGKALVEAAAKAARIRQDDITAIFAPNKKLKRKFVVVQARNNYIKLEGTDANTIIAKEKKLKEFLHSIGTYH